MKPKILVYINSHVAHFLDQGKMKKFINSKIGHKNWTFFGDLYVSELLQDEGIHIDDNFFHGVSAHQYTMIRSGGTFINPMLYGLHSDFSLWSDILHNDPEFEQEIVYIDIPYDIYYDVAHGSDEYFVDETKYNDMSQNISGMVVKMQDVFYVTRKEIH